MNPVQLAQAATQYGIVGVLSALIVVVAGVAALLYRENRSLHGRVEETIKAHYSWAISEVERRTEMEHRQADALELLAQHADAELEAHKAILDSLLGGHR